jgi:hypothetical protein
MLLKLNSVGKDVEKIQEILDITKDGVFGKKTESAVKNFQISSGLKPDGIVGDKTWEAINDLDTDESNSDSKNLYSKHYLPYGEFSKQKTLKDYLFIHHTAGWNNPFKTIDRWGRDSRGMVATEFVIGGQNIKKSNDLIYDGEIVQAFPTGHYAWHLGKNGNQKMHTNSVGVELNNFGYIENGRTYVGGVAIKNQVVELDKEFRGHKFWHRYSNKQIKSLEKLIKFIAERDNIDVRDGLPREIGKHGAKAFEFNTEAYYGTVKGLWTHTNTRKTKYDCFPQQELMDMLMSL